MTGEETIGGAATTQAAPAPHAHHFPMMKAPSGKHDKSPALPSPGPSANAAPSPAASTTSSGSTKKHHGHQGRSSWGSGHHHHYGGAGANKVSPVGATAASAIAGSSVSPQQHSKDLSETATKVALSGMFSPTSMSPSVCEEPASMTPYRTTKSKSIDAEMALSPDGTSLAEIAKVQKGGRLASASERVQSVLGPLAHRTRSISVSLEWITPPGQTWKPPPNWNPPSTESVQPPRNSICSDPDPKRSSTVSTKPQTPTLQAGFSPSEGAASGSNSLPSSPSSVPIKSTSAHELKTAALTAQRKVPSSPSMSSLFVAATDVPLPPVPHRRMSQFKSNADDGEDFSSDPEFCKRDGHLKSNSVSSLTGVKDQRKFARVFPSLVDDSESLFRVYPCAIEKEGLWQGKMYLTAQHCCFHGNVFGNTINLAIPWETIIAIEKKSTAGMFPNAIRLITADAMYVFSSYLKRDTSFAEMVDLWKQCKPTIVNHNADLVASRSYNDILHLTNEDGGDLIAGGTIGEEAASLRMPPPTDTDSVVGGTSKRRGRANTQLPPSVNYKSFEESPEHDGPITRSGRAATFSLFRKLMVSTSNAPSPDGSAEGLALSSPTKLFSNFTAPSRSLSRQASETNVAINIIASTPVDTSVDPRALPALESTSAPSSPLAAPVQTPSVAVNSPKTSTKPTEPVQCKCGTHPENVVISEIIRADVNSLYSAIFGDGANDVTMDAHRKRETEGLKIGEWGSEACGPSRELTYNPSFKMSIMPKSNTPCVEKQVILCQEEFCRTVETTSRTPKVPYGEFFTVVNRYCITYETPSSTRLTVTTKLDFTKKLLLKDRIEAGALEGVESYVRELVSSFYATKLFKPLECTDTASIRSRRRKPNSLAKVESYFTSDEPLSDSAPPRRSAGRRNAAVSVGTPDECKGVSPSASSIAPTTIWFAICLYLWSYPVRLFFLAANYVNSVLGWPQFELKPLVTVAAVNTAAGSVLPGQQSSPTRQRPERRRSSRSKTRSNSFYEKQAAGGGGGPPPEPGVINGILASFKGLGVLSAMLVGVMMLAVVVGVTITVLNVVWMADIGDRLDKALDAVREARANGVEIPEGVGPARASERRVVDEERISAAYEATRRTFKSLSRSQLGSAKASLAEAGRSAELMREKLSHLKAELAEAVDIFALTSAASKKVAKNVAVDEHEEGPLQAEQPVDDGTANFASFTAEDQRRMVEIIVSQLAVAAKSKESLARSKDSAELHVSSGEASTQSEENANPHLQAVETDATS